MSRHDDRLQPHQLRRSRNAVLEEGVVCAAALVVEQAQSLEAPLLPRHRARAQGAAPVRALERMNRG
jgi:hypothetical protein